MVCVWSGLDLKINSLLSETDAHEVASIKEPSVPPGVAQETLPFQITKDENQD